MALRHTPERQAAFDKIKEMLTTAPVLAVPKDDSECVYRLDTDASATSAFAILKQLQDGKYRVVEYASRCFSAAERAYCATHREMAALIFGLKQFRQYLLGRYFVVRVDNMALTFYQRMKDPTRQAARYLEILSNYTFDIQHRDGARHVNADSVSRVRSCELDNGEPCRQCNRRVTGQHLIKAVQTRSQRAGAPTDGVTADCAEAVSDAPPGSSGIAPRREGKRKRKPRLAAALNVTAPAAWKFAASWTSTSVREKQLSDRDIEPALMWVESDDRPHWAAVQGISSMLRSLWQQFDSLTVRDGVLYRLLYNSAGSVTQFQLVLPADMKASFLKLVHSDAAAHLKFAKCVPHVMRRAWWLTWRRDLQLFIRCCPKCEAYHRGISPPQATLNPMLVGAPGERYSLNLTCVHLPSNGYRYMLTALCCFNKFGICVPIRNNEASTVAKAIVDHVFLKWGLCFEVLVDQGPEFEAKLTQEFSKILAMRHLRTSGYRFQTNGTGL